MPSPTATISRLALLAAGDVPDGLLVSRFLAGHASALETIVQRHGPAVLGVCRRVLGPGPDADDAFQATFLTLAQRAPAIRRPEALAAWLHGVALRCCRKAVARRPVSPPSDPADPADPFADVTWRELRRLLDEELARLPTRFRAPLVLCHLQGRARDEAARQLGWSLRTLDRRLARAREVLKARLTRRGVAPIGLSLAVLSGEGLRASVPPHLIAAACSAPASASPAVRALVPATSTGIVLKTTLGLLVLFGGTVAGLGFGRSTPAPKVADRPETEAEPAVVDDDGLPLPEGAIRRFGSIRFRHPHSVAHSVLSPDGKRVAIGSYQQIVVYDTTTGKPVHALRDSGMTNVVWHLPAMAISPDGKYLAHIVRDGDVVARVWDLATGKEVSRVAGLRPQPSFGPIPAVPGNEVVQSELFSALLFTADGKAIVIVGTLYLHVHDVMTGNEIGKYDIPYVMTEVSGQPQLGKALRSPAELLAFAADGARYVCNQGRDLEVRDLKGDKTLFSQRLSDKQKDTFVALSPDGGTLAMPTADWSAVDLWDVAAARVVKTLRQADAKPVRLQTRLGFSPDGKVLFAGADKAVYRWEVASGQMLPPLVGHAGYYVPVAHASADGQTLVTVCGDGVIRRWDPATGKPFDVPHGYAWYSTTALAPDGKSLALADGVGRLDLWSIDGTQRNELKSGTEPAVLSVRFSPDGRTLAAGLADGHVRLWDLRTRREIRTFVAGLRGSGERVDAMDYTPKGDLAIAGAAVGVRFWDVTADKPRWTRELRGVEDLVASPDGKWIAASRREEGEIHLLDAKTGETRRVWRRPADKDREWNPNRTAFTPDGRWLLSAHYEGEIRVWNVESGELRRTMAAPSVAWDVAVAPDGRWVASVSSDGVARIWEFATGTEVLHRLEPGGDLSHVAFTPDGHGLLSATRRGAILWSLVPGRQRTGDRDRLWAALASEGPFDAYRSQWALARSGQGLAEFVREKLGAAVPADAANKIPGLVADLDAPTYRQREAATKELARLGPMAATALREALAKTNSDEVHRRAGQLLERLAKDPPPDQLRMERAVQALALSDDSGADKLLAEWAAGAAGAPLTEAAKAAQRLKVVK